MLGHMEFKQFVGNRTRKIPKKTIFNRDTFLAKKTHLISEVDKDTLISQIVWGGKVQGRSQGGGGAEGAAASREPEPPPFVNREV